MSCSSSTCWSPVRGEAARLAPEDLILALLSSIPPLFTWLFESWALRNGKLDGPQRLSHGGVGLFAKSPETAAA